MRMVTLNVLFAVAVSVTAIGPVHASQSKDIASEVSKAYRTRTGKSIIVSETHPTGRSLGTIEIRTEGFENNYGEVFEDRDPISEVFVADLDGNGFDEIYIVTTAAGSGSYGTVLGFASNKDKSLSMIHFTAIRKGDENFEGYMGHDIFTIEGRNLVRVFPVYDKGDTNRKPTGGRRKLAYGLVPGEAGWQLRIEQRERLKGADIDLSARTLIRWRQHGGGQDQRKGPLTVPANKLGEQERQQVLNTANSAQFRDLSPKQIVPKLADQGVYLASESTFYRFRTMKYRPEYPSRPFDNIEHAQSLVDGFVLWYNTQHLHSSIRYVTPDDRHYGWEDAILANRKKVYEAARVRKFDSMIISLRLNKAKHSNERTGGVV